MVDTIVQTIGEAGILHTDRHLIIGQMPEIKNRDSEGNALKSPILDMNPTIIGFADLLQLLIDQNDAGRPTYFVGHIQVRPTSKDTRIMITDDGNVMVEGC